MSEPREGGQQGANHSTGFTEAIDLTISGKAHHKSSLRKGVIVAVWLFETMVYPTSRNM